MRVALSIARRSVIKPQQPGFIHTINCQSRQFSKSSSTSQDGFSKSHSPGIKNDIVPVVCSPNNVALFKKDLLHLSRHDACTKHSDRVLGPLSPSDIAIQKRLGQQDSSPIEVLRQSIQESTISPHVIRLCLRQHYEKVEKLPRKTRHALHAEQKAEGFARLLLSVLWTDEKLWTTLVMNDMHSLFIICYYAILESLEEYVIEWAFVAIADESSPLAGPGKHNFWRGTLLQRLIMAYDAFDTANCADAMLTCMQRMVDRSKTVSIEQASLVALNKPASYCEGSLWAKLGGRTDGLLYDNFVQLRLEMLASPLEMTSGIFTKAKLQLCHPQAPTEATALQFLREWDGCSSKTNPKHWEIHSHLLQRTFDVAMDNGNVNDAEWIKRRFRERLDPATDRFVAPLKRDILASRIAKRKTIQTQRTEWPRKTESPLIRRVAAYRPSDHPSTGPSRTRRLTTWAQLPCNVNPQTRHFSSASSRALSKHSPPAPRSIAG